MENLRFLDKWDMTSDAEKLLQAQKNRQRAQSGQETDDAASTGSPGSGQNPVMMLATSRRDIHCTY